MLAKAQAAAAAVLGAIGAALAVFAFMSLVAVPAAREEERKLAEADAKDAIFDQLKERGGTDASVEKMSPAELCGAIGGVLVNGDCQ
ncbi:hypothetical protein [Rhizobium halophilum]|uniref:hypothetical protein n=1 Tax=Rhizobium halophilum TaxID=2846852 RepID=UPI001EFCA333|nr:hypothetical protein [Rhizobium halophilum]MCF6368350.1 hypothetical protein [Rhizobium halophilum]